jgi:hypothetical protein
MDVYFAWADKFQYRMLPDEYENFGSIKRAHKMGPKGQNGDFS